MTRMEFTNESIEADSEMDLVIQGTVHSMMVNCSKNGIAPDTMLCGTIKGLAYFAARHRNENSDRALFEEALTRYFRTVIGKAVDFIEAENAQTGATVQ
jgi:hypothetical protein